MNSYLVDSDVLIDFFNKREEATNLLYKFLSEFSVAISVLSLMELRAGWNKKQRDIYFPLLFDLFTVKVVTGEVAELAGSIRYDYKRKGVVLSGIDCLIASTAILGNYILVTKNVKDFPMRELTLYRNKKLKA